LSDLQTPYVGPSPIQANQPFYGRESERKELIDRLVAHRIVLLHSPSGAGKTSLIQAGLLPEMRELGYHTFPRTLVGRQPAAGAVPAAVAYNPYILSILMLLDESLPKAEQTPIEKLASTRLLDYLNHHLQRHADLDDEAAPGRCLLIFDQFEEILTLNPADRDGKLAFFGELMQVLYDYRFWALFAMREDYIAGLEPYLSYLPERLSARFRLELLGPDQALEAIQNPARDFGVNFEDEAASHLVKELRQVYVQTRQGGIEKHPGPFVEPVQLQVVCANLWAAPRPDKRRITLDDVSQYGDVDNALGSYYAHRVAEAAEAGAMPESSLRFWIDERLLTPQGLRRQVLSGPDPEYGIQDAAIRRLVDAYILREEQRRGAAWLELAHDRLVDPVRKDNAEWFEGHLSLLQRRAIQWERERRPDDLFLFDQALLEAKTWAKEWTGRGLVLTRSEQELLTRSQDANRQVEEERQAQAIAERQQLELQAAQEKAELQARAARRQRLLLVGISLLAVFVLIMLGVTLRSLQSTRHANATAQSERAVAVARLTELFAADATGVARNATSTSLANQSTVVANLRLTSDAATAQAAQLQQLAQVANEFSMGLASPPPAATPEPGATEGPIIPVTGGGYPYDNLLSAADRLKSSQPQLSLLLSAIAYDMSGESAEVGASIYRLASDLSPAGYSPATPLGDLGAPALNIGFNPGATSLLANNAPGDVISLNPNGVQLGAVRGVPADTSNIIFDPAGNALALVAPQAEGVSIGRSTEDTILWQEAAKSGRTFAALQVSPTSLDEKNLNGDNNRFRSNWNGMIGSAEFQDLVRGAYWIFNPGLDPVKQADLFYNIITDESIISTRRYGQPGDLPIILQVSQSGGLGRADLAGAVKACLDRLQELTGRAPILYTAPDFWDASMVDPAGQAPPWTADYPLWVRDPGAKDQPRLPKGWSAWAFWDYQAVEPTDANRHSMPSVGDQTIYYLSRYNGSLANLEDLANKPRTRQALRDTTVSMWDIDKAQPLRRLQLNPNDLVAVAGSPAGNFFLSSQKDGVILQWDIKALLLTGDAETRASGATSYVGEVTQEPVTSLQLSHKSRWWVATDLPGNGYIDSLLDLVQPQAFLDCNKERSRSLSFSPDELWLAGATDRRVCLWRLAPQRDANFEAFRTLVVEPGNSAIAFDPSSSYLATGGLDVPLRVWDMKALESEPLVLPAPPGEVTSLAFSSDGAILAAGLATGELNLWFDRAAEGQPVMIKAHQGRINDLVFDPASAWLYTVSGDGSLLAWDLVVLSDPKLLACQLAGRNPTTNELKAFGFDDSMIATYGTICQ
jgi:hypothetical protein